ncbi:hypothetical protein BD414DRAFT_417698 [Trametes punicea]|nr:hypothetical protein BD414DRAFT_417698 [Trametes punicea]
MPAHGLPTRAPSARQQLADLNLPTYVLSAEECPPDDDRRHCCGICHRRFNRPSSLRIHMNSHTGDQPYQCLFPGCSRRFSVNSNMRRHYRNHMKEPSVAPPALYTPQYHREEPPQLLYRMNSSPSSSSASALSSFSDSEDHSDAPGMSTNNRAMNTLPQGRTRSASEMYPPIRGRPASRPRACTMPGCNCGGAAPAALHPAFPPGPSAPRYLPNSR